MGVPPFMETPISSRVTEVISRPYKVTGRLGSHDNANSGRPNLSSFSSLKHNWLVVEPYPSEK